MAKRKQNNQPFWRFLFVVYCATMLWLLFGRPQGGIDGLTYRQILQQHTNLQPLLTIKNYWHVLRTGTDRSMLIHCFINLAGNVLLFIPAGYLLPRIFPKMRNVFRFLFFCAGVILVIEILQLFTLLGSFDIDDLILNLSGMFFGFLYYTLAAALKK